MVRINGIVSFSGGNGITGQNILKTDEVVDGMTVSNGGMIKVIDRETTSITKSSYDISGVANVLSGVITTLASIIFGAMWGSIILAGVSAARGLRQSHKANVVRRDEIMSELLKNKDARDLKECLEFLNGDIESQKTLIEMYQSGDVEFYNAINNLQQQKVLKEDFSKYKK